MGRAARTGDLIVAFSATDEALSLSQTQSDWLEATNRLKLLLDVRPLQADLVRADRICPIASFTGSREHGAPPSAQCPAAEVLQAANLRQHRSADICRTLWLGVNRTRTHLSLNKDSPVSRAVESFGRILPVPILGGLHHRYLRI